MNMEIKTIILAIVVLLLMAMTTTTAWSQNGSMSRIRVGYIVNDSIVDSRSLRLEVRTANHTSVPSEIRNDTLRLESIPDDSTLYFTLVYRERRIDFSLNGYFLEGTWKLIIVDKPSCWRLLWKDEFSVLLNISSMKGEGITFFLAND